MITSMQVTVQYSTSCQSNGCFIKAGSKANWLKTIGYWCLGCPEPQSAKKDVAKHEEAVRLGLATPDFGTAPLLKEACTHKTAGGQRCILGLGHSPENRHETETKIVFYE